MNLVLVVCIFIGKGTVILTTELEIFLVKYLQRLHVFLQLQFVMDVRLLTFRAGKHLFASNRFLMFKNSVGTLIFEKIRNIQTSGTTLPIPPPFRIIS
mgnify:CR=1 FL=1